MENTATSPLPYRGYIHTDSFVVPAKSGNIVPRSFSSAQVLDAVETELRSRLSAVHGPVGGAEIAADFAQGFEDGICSLGSPALTNLLHLGTRPFASCAAVPLLDAAAAEAYYALNMGSGYNLNASLDPAAELRRLNYHAHRYQNAGSCERYVGNMAHVSANHPRVWEFAAAKRNVDLRHFNISIDFSEAHIRSLLSGDELLANLLMWISENTFACGDPGVLSLDRYNATNPLRASSPYTTTAPCAEVGLAPGDTCLFGYINVAGLVQNGDLDYARLRHATRVVALSLDALVDDNVAFLPPESRVLAYQKRRVGIGICGYADALAWLGHLYGSDEAVALLEDLLSVIQYEAKLASIELADLLGAFPAFDVATPCDPERMPATRLVSSADWTGICSAATVTGLRNAVSTALPPAGRTSLLLGVNGSIEPFLSDPASSARLDDLRRHVMTTYSEDSGQRRGASEIPWPVHLDTVVAASRFVDEGVSKTVNLGPAATAATINEIFRYGLRHGLRAVAVYRAR